MEKNINLSEIHQPIVSRWEGNTSLFKAMQSMELIIEAFRQYCISRNVRQSSIKVKVLLKLWLDPVYKSADNIFVELKNTGANCTAASVYNALNWLLAEGFLIKDSSLRKALYYCEKKESIMLLKLPEETSCGFARKNSVI